MLRRLGFSIGILTALVVMTASCGTTPRPAPAVALQNASAPSKTVQVEGALRPGEAQCPSGEDLDRVARQAWEAGGGDLVARCVAIVHAGKPLWFITGAFATRNSFGETFGAVMRSIVSLDGNVVWSRFYAVVPLSDIAAWVDDRFEAVDLDDDGDDEIIHEDVIVVGAHEQGLLRVLRVSFEVEEIDSFEFCDGRYSILRAEDGFKSLEITSATTCGQPGVRRLGFDGQRFEEEIDEGDEDVEED